MITEFKTKRKKQVTEIVPDGHGVRVPLIAMDSVQQAVVSSTVPVSDAMGQPAGQRPGFIYQADGEAKQRAIAARTHYVDQIANAWRN